MRLIYDEVTRNVPVTVNRDTLRPRAFFPAEAYIPVLVLKRIGEDISDPLNAERGADATEDRRTVKMVIIVAFIDKIFQFFCTSNICLIFYGAWC